MKFTVNMLLTCILYCGAGPGSDLNSLQVQLAGSYYELHICPRTFFLAWSSLNEAEQWHIQHAKRSTDLRVNSYI